MTQDASILHWRFDFRLRPSPTGTRIISLEGNFSPGALLSQKQSRRRSIELMHGDGEWLRDRRAVYGYCLGGGMHRAAGRAELLFERS